MTLAMDGAAKPCRVVYPHWGLASPWFETTPSGGVFRMAPATDPPDNTLQDE